MDHARACAPECQLKKKWQDFVGTYRNQTPQHEPIENTGTGYQGNIDTTAHAPLNREVQESRAHNLSPHDEGATSREQTDDSNNDNRDPLFHDCESPVQQRNNDEGPPLPAPLSPPEPIDHEGYKNLTNGIDNDLQSACTIDPRYNFPLTAEGISNAINKAKAGDICDLTWGFDCQDTLSVSRGTVSSANHRSGRTKLSMEYSGVQGHKVNNTFKGFLPPQTNVRVYKIQWVKRQIPMDHSERSKTNVSQTVTKYTEEDLDLTPMPKLRAIYADFAPCVIAIYRDIIRDYAISSYDLRNDIWNRVLSAMKHSLTVVRTASRRQKRRRPFPDDENDMDTDEKSKAEMRTIKKATRLALEGCVTKATKVLDQEVRPHELTDDEICEKLKDLHPQNHETFDLPDDSPEIAIIATEELRAAGRRLVKGSAPGPTGTTDIIIRLLLDDEICCVSMCHMLADLINGFLSKQVMNRLKRSRLVAIPKVDKGIRPICVGEVFLKLAGIVLVARHEHTLEKLFAPLQFGVSIQSGCEKVVHRLQSHYQEGKAILSIDLANAFNSPMRSDIAKVVFGLCTLRTFRRFFHTEYSEASELLYYGKNGEHYETIYSSAGVRQGSPLSTLYFCAFMQPILETLAAEFPQVKIFAFIDDINMASEDHQALANAFLRLHGLLAEKRVKMAKHKCVWFSGKNKIPIPETLQTEGVKTENAATKTLGAFIGDDEVVSECLAQKLKKHETIFRRLKLMGLNNISLLLLSKSVNIRHRYHTRVHTPAASEKLCKQFDKEVEEVMRTWLGKMSDKHISWCRLPVKKGGLGLPSSAETRNAAYNSSKRVSLERCKINSARLTHDEEMMRESEVVSDDGAVTDAMLNQKVYQELTKKNEEVAPLVKACSEKGNHDWLQGRTRCIPSSQFTLVVMARLGIAHRSMPNNFLCPGCKMILESKHSLAHLLGCVKCTGANATTRHNALVRHIYDLCLRAGIPCEREPRQFTSYRCLKCTEAVSEQRKQEHQKTCGTTSFHRSGPDLVIFWVSGEIFYDFTVTNELSKSNIHKRGAQLMQEAEKRKLDTYVNSDLIPREKFVCLSVLAGGAMNKSSVALLKALADANGRDRETVVRDFGMHLQELNGVILNAQMGKALSQV